MAFSDDGLRVSTFTFIPLLNKLRATAPPILPVPPVTKIEVGICIIIYLWVTINALSQNRGGKMLTDC